MRNDNDFWNSYAVQVGTLWRHDEGDEFLSWGPFGLKSLQSQSGLLTSVLSFLNAVAGTSAKFKVAHRILLLF